MELQIQPKLYICLAELTEIATYCGWFRHDGDYVKDDTFDRWVVTPNIPNYRAARRFIRKLEAECPGCVKARCLRSRFENKFWREEGRWQAAIAASRRTCCGKHETGSYAMPHSSFDRECKRLHEKVLAPIREQYIHRQHQERMTLLMSRHDSLYKGV